MRTDEEHAGIPENVEDVLADAVTEGVNKRVGETASDEVESQVEVCQGEKGEQELEELIEEFDVEENLAGNGMISLPDLFIMDQRVNSGEEGAVQPSSTLRDEFGYGI